MNYSSKIFFHLAIFFITINWGSFSIGQCNEYYINELILGTNETCILPAGSPVRFCPSLKGISIAGVTYDVSQWSGISKQYLTLTKNGNIVGTLVLNLEDEKLLINMNGCGEPKKYSISLTKSDYWRWIDEKPYRERVKNEKLLQEQEIQKQKNDIQNIIEKHNLNSFFRIIDSSLVNPIIRNNIKFRKILEVCNVDTLIIDFKNGEITKLNFEYNKSLDLFCDSINTFLFYQRGHPTLSPDERKKLDELRWTICKNETTALGYRNYSISDLFSSSVLKSDTLIDGFNIPVNVRLLIVLNEKIDYSIDMIYAPVKFNGENLYYSKEPFNDKYFWSGYYATTKTQGFEDVPIEVNFYKGKNLVILKKKYKLIYANNIYLNKTFIGNEKDLFKFKKVKTN